MTLVANGMLAIAFEPRKDRSRLPLIGRRLARRADIRDEAAFERAETAVLKEAEKHGETIVTAFTFRRAVSKAPAPTRLLSITSPFGLFAMAALGPADARKAMAERRYGATRVAAVSDGSIIVATPKRAGVEIVRHAFDDIASVILDPPNHGVRTVTVSTADDTFRIEGLVEPKQFATEALKAFGESRLARIMSDERIFEQRALEVAVIRKRLRHKGWMLAVANDYRLHGEWHVFYSFTNAEGTACKGEGTSDLEALRLAEVDALAKEAWIRTLKEKAA